MKWIILAFVIGVYNNSGISIKQNNAFGKQFESQAECDEYVKVRNIRLTTTLHKALNTTHPSISWDVKGFACIPKSVYDSLPSSLEPEGIQA